MALSLEATRVSEDSLPVISVEGLSSSKLKDRQGVASMLRKACLDKGFFYVSNHGISLGLIDAVFEQTKRLFELPDEAKAVVDMAHSICHRGYERLRAQTLEAGAPPDLKEGFYIGPDLSLEDPRVIAQRFQCGPNLWPQDMPAFRPTMQAYFAAMLDLSHRLMHGLALSLDLPEDHFNAFNRDPLAILRLLHYPPQPTNAEPNEKGAGAHTDWGALTVLLQDPVGGLQVQDVASDRWIHADPIPGTFVVNLGDMIARWTNDRYRSTTHRVVNASGRERYSVPFFYEGRTEHEVVCLANCLAPREKPRYAPTTVEGHLKEMYQRTYAA